MSASIWQVVQQRDAMNYAMLAEFVSLVTEMVPELLIYRHRAQLILGLRARVSVTTLMNECIGIDRALMYSFENPRVEDVSDTEVESSETHFLELVQTLLKDPDEREHFFTEIFPVEYGPQYDIELQTLLWEFLSRLVQLLPTPDLAQVRERIPFYSHLLLLQHHKRLGHLEQHVPPCAMGDCILSSLSIPPHSRTMISTEQTTCDNQSESLEEFVDDFEVEIVTLTDYEEVEFGLKTPDHEEGDLESNSHLEEAENDPASSHHQTSSGPHICSVCEKSFKFASALIAHQVIHTGERPYVCHLCGRCFSFRQSLDRHKQTHKDGRVYDCLICGETFQSLSKNHMENGVYRCSECDRRFSWKSALVRHLRTHTENATEAELSYKCPRCDLGFSSSTYLNRHLLTHQEERLHVCSCGKNFAYKAALTAHQRTHLKERPHQCKQCGKGFLYKGGLVSHMKIHSEEMPFMCSFCGKSFKRERNMKKHERCHTRENVFSCSQCDKTFVYKATLTRHELTHSGERPFLCSDCGKGFFSHAELLKHERFHTGHKPFQCSHCGKQFTQSCYLTIHLRYHTGVRPYSCTHCDKSFLSANRLKRHLRTHTGEKPYLCSECGKGFKQSYHLKMHQQTHATKIY
uniref:C2H2-type domain-containing protein n=1 Tax=Oncorhynchus kisutch TaxID=8019 RepID=A0A8C7ISV3_ONCKI